MYIPKLQGLFGNYFIFQLLIDQFLEFLPCSFPVSIHVCTSFFYDSVLPVTGSILGQIEIATFVFRFSGFLHNEAQQHNRNDG